MNAGHASWDSNRLPWLNDVAAPVAPRRPKNTPLAYFIGGVAAAFLIAGASYWLGLRSMLQPEPASETTISLPGPTYNSAQQMAAEEESKSTEQPVPRVVLVPQQAPYLVRQALPPVERDEAAGSQSEATASPPQDGAISSETPSGSETAPAAADPKVQPVPAPAAPLRLWPADVSEGASGRAVRIGTYSSRLQAKKAWAKLVRLYPGMGRLKAVVAPAPSVRNGRTYYRLQFGTTSHAHSAVLCQRMRIVGQSCVVIGTPQGSGAATT